MPIHAYVGHQTGGNGGGISCHLWDEDSGTLKKLGEVAAIDDVIWLVVDAPSARLYACTAPDGGRESNVHAFAIDLLSGALTALNSQPAGGSDCCHASLSRDGRFLMVANYNGAPAPGTPDHAVRVFPVTAEGLGAPVATMSHHGTGPNESRQERDHAHWVKQAPDSDTVLVADLGMDRLVAYTLKDDGALLPKPVSDIVTAAGLGPRHAVFTPDGGQLFVITELIAAVLALKANPGLETMTETASAMVPVPAGKRVQPSGIVLSADGRYLYGALRGTNEILGLAIDPASGGLQDLGRWASGGANPRDLILSPGGKFLFVAHQDGHCLSLHGVDAGTGHLNGPPTQIVMPAPMLIAFAGS
jgi:6-phosphogluconolactonase